MREKRKGKIGIRTKLIGVIIPIVFVIIICFFALSRSMVTKLSLEKLEAESLVYAGEISAWVNQIFAELEVYQDTIEEGGFTGDEAILAYMRTTVDRNPAYPIGLYMGDDAGTYLDATDWVPGDDWILTERDWYLDGKDNEEFAFGEPYYDSQTGDVCVSASVHVDYPKATRVLAADIYLDYVSGLVSNISEKDIGTAFLVTKNSQTIIAHPQEEMMDAVLSADGADSLYANIGAELSAGHMEVLTVEGDDGTYFACVNSIPHTDWLLVSCISRQEVLLELHKLEGVMALIAAAAALVLIFITMHLMNRVVKPVERVTDVIQQVAKGDFTQNIEAKENDEIGRMNRNVQDFLVQMRETISGIVHTADWLDKQSEEHSRVSGSLMASAREQTEAMQALEVMVQELSASAMDFMEQMQELSETIENADAEGKHAGKMMTETVKVSENGREAVDHVSEGMEHIKKSITSLAGQIAQADASMERIGSMVGLIMDVAEETNLLSLNASIEAARAGESGKGFAIVAEQIGKLAVNSSAAADDIAKLTEEIKSTMKQLTVQMQESVCEVEDSAKMVEQTGSSFVQVFERVVEAEKAVTRVTELTDSVKEVSVQMKQISERQEATACQITESAKRMNGCTKAVGSDSDAVEKSAKELEREAGVLMERMSRFQI